MTLKYDALEHTERALIEAWHATFNAALTGILSRTWVDPYKDAEPIAKMLADKVHGSIEVDTHTK